MNLFQRFARSGVGAHDAVWIILAGTGNAVRGRFAGTREDAEAWCRAHYLPGGWTLALDPDWKGWKTCEPT